MKLGHNCRQAAQRCLKQQKSFRLQSVDFNLQRTLLAAMREHVGSNAPDHPEIKAARAIADPVCDTSVCSLQPLSALESTLREDVICLKPKVRQQSDVITLFAGWRLYVRGRLY